MVKGVLMAGVMTVVVAGSSPGGLRPPAVPLVACDPYFSIWSPADRLSDADTVHWTGRPHRLTLLVRIDGAAYRVMGAEPAGVPALAQQSLDVLPTRTVYVFEGGGVALTLTFLTPALPDDLDVLSRPVTYVIQQWRSTDGKPHAVAAYADASAELAVNVPSQEVIGGRVSDVPGLAVVKVGSKTQNVLAKRGDDIRIDWGYLYVAGPTGAVTGSAFGNRDALQRAFVGSEADAFGKVHPVAGPAAAGALACALTLDIGPVATAPVERWLMLAYDDLYSIQYMKKDLRPYWRRSGWEASDLLKASAGELGALRRRCEAFDGELMGDLARAGGERYARIAALAFRQCFAAGKFVADDNGQPLQFCKENHSNGCIGTSDVFYPMAPQFLLFGATLAKTFLVPFMNYAASERWTFPFAPHDLGQYPHANGQRYGGGEKSERNQMPVEESGNLLILMGAIAQMEGNAGFAGLYWPQLERWAAYLKDKGFDPENQLCTDDFAGHLAHNVNLSAKAICGMGAFAKLCELRGDTARAKEYHSVAKACAERWVKEADDGDHYSLAFDRPGTWSQKYNLVWDRILELGLFPASVATKEMAYYKKVQNPYGLPLDNRKSYTKLDWVLWTATLTGERADFEALVDPVYRFLSETPDRSPMTDWYFTDNAKKRGFTARPVVGGVFLRMLYERDVWARYVSRERTHGAGWAPMPMPPKTVTLVPASQEKPASWRYTFAVPSANWFAPDFDDHGWQEGAAGFGTRNTPGAVVRTVWNTADIWVRRVIELPDPVPAKVALLIHHDEDADVYLNGVAATHAAGFTCEYEVCEIADAARAALRPGRNTIAIHCHQTQGGQYIDAGLEAIVPR